MKTTHHAIRLWLLAALVLSAFTTSHAEIFPDVDLNYSIRYKWGFIEKQAAIGNFTLVNEGNASQASLTVQTDPWADRVYEVRDTLISEMSASYIPERYYKRCHQAGTVQRDVVVYSRRGDNVQGDAHRVKKEGAAPAAVSDTVLYAQGPTFDMLSIFCYLRSLDIPSMQPGQAVNVNLFSAYKVEQMAATFDGIEDVDISGVPMQAYRFTFTFTRDGAPCADPMYVWYSTDARRVPLKLIGVLPIGRVECFLLD